MERWWRDEELSGDSGGRCSLVAKEVGSTARIMAINKPQCSELTLLIQISSVESFERHTQCPRASAATSQMLKEKRERRIPPIMAISRGAEFPAQRSYGVSEDAPPCARCGRALSVSLQHSCGSGLDRERNAPNASLPFLHELI